MSGRRGIGDPGGVFRMFLGVQHLACPENLSHPTRVIHQEQRDPVVSGDIPRRDQLTFPGSPAVPESKTFREPRGPLRDVGRRAILSEVTVDKQKSVPSRNELRFSCGERSSSTDRNFRERPKYRRSSAQPGVVVSAERPAMGCLRVFRQRDVIVEDRGSPTTSGRPLGLLRSRRPAGRTVAVFPASLSGPGGILDTHSTGRFPRVRARAMHWDCTLQEFAVAESI